MTMYWQSTPLATVPAMTVMASTEELPLGFEMAAYLDDGETIDEDTIASTLTDVTTGQLIALEHPPTLAGTEIVQRVGGLTPNRVYQLVVSFEVASTTKRWSAVLAIRCPV